MIRKWLALDQIRLDGGTYSRAGNETDGTHVVDLARLIQAGEVMTPVDVFYDGENYWLAHGFYRYWAAEAVGREQVEAAVRLGTQQEAVRFSAGVNTESFLPRTDADKRLAVQKILDDPGCATWSNVEIASWAKVGSTLVRTMRPAVTSRERSEGEEETRTYINKHGQVATMRVGAIGRRQGASEPSEGSQDGKPHLRLVAPPRSPLAGHREQDGRSRSVSTFEAVESILRAQRTLSLSPEQALSDLGGNIDYQQAVAVRDWWDGIVLAKRRQIERAG